MRRSLSRSSIASHSACPQAQRTISSATTSRSKSSAERSLASRKRARSAPCSRFLLTRNSATASVPSLLVDRHSCVFGEVSRKEPQQPAVTCGLEDARAEQPDLVKDAFQHAV